MRVIALWRIGTVTMNKGQWVKPVLIVSLAINLVFMGLVAGRLIAGPIEPPPLFWALRALPEENRQALRPALRRQFMESREVRKALRSVSKQVRMLVEADTLDNTALRASLADLREVTGRYQLQIHETAVTLLETLPADQRRRVAGALLRPEHAQRPKPHGPHRTMPSKSMAPEAANLPDSDAMSSESARDPNAR